MRPAEIATEHDAAAGVGKLDRAGAEKVACVAQSGLHARHDFPPFIHGHPLNTVEGFHGISLGVERQRRLVFRCTVAIDVARFFFLQVTAIREQNTAQVARRVAGKNGAVETVANQRRHVSAVIQMRMCEDHRINGGGRYREWCPVAQPQRFVALEQAAIDKQSLVVLLYQIARTCDGASCASESDFHLISSR